ncbi:iron ABC transporter permease [Alloprevotella sp. Lung230]|uniref:iron ABC transporter permease n=1 Tax=Alloprevotella sp. Lung230 TaxID=2766595 RepID=UPI002105266D|nr:iron ABC transporter permease [Alloprevotella sp. Lung230]
MMRFLFLVALVLLLALANLLMGSVRVSVAEVWQVLTHPATESTASFIVLQHRLPQLLTALLAGASLAVGGAVLQTLFRNPLADPSLLGVNAGASLGAAVALLLWGGVVSAGGWVLSGFVLTLVFALAGALAVLFLLVGVARRLSGAGGLLIVGVMLSFIASSAVSLLNFFATAEGVRSYMLWGMGDFSTLGADRLPLVAVALLPAWIGLIVAIKPLDALLLGSDYARSMGVDVGRTRWLLLLAVGWLSALVTATCGPIAFLGLAAPHLARLLFRTALHRTLLPAAFLTGAALALLCLLISRWPGTDSILPINAITPLIGAPLVIVLLLKK